jgi:hypothetical protein
VRRALAVSLLALAGAGCGGSHPPAAPPKLPPGYARYAASGVSFDHPAAWTRANDAPGLIEFYGAQGTGGFPPQVAIGSGKARNDLSQVVQYHRDTQKIRYPDYRVLAERAVTLPGAKGAHRIDAEYTLQRPQHPEAKVREIDLLVLTEDGRQLDFFVRGPVADFTAARLGTIFDSFRLQ